MSIQPDRAADPDRHRKRALIAFCVLLVPAGFYLFAEHRAHLFGVLPYLLLALCPLMHLFMHRNHTHGSSDHMKSTEPHDHTRRR